MKPLPVLRTERLILRQPSRRDIPQIFTTPATSTLPPLPLPYRTPTPKKMLSTGCLYRLLRSEYATQDDPGGSEQDQRPG